MMKATHTINDNITFCVWWWIYLPALTHLRALVNVSGSVAVLNLAALTLDWTVKLIIIITNNISCFYTHTHTHRERERERGRERERERERQTDRHISTHRKIEERGEKCQVYRLMDRQRCFYVTTYLVDEDPSMH